MARYVLLCTIDEYKLDLFGRHRAEHYGFLISQQHRIVFGGPARVAEGARPETMIIVIEADSVADSEAFIAAEPYNKRGGFSHVVIDLGAKCCRNERRVSFNAFSMLKLLR